MKRLIKTTGLAAVAFALVTICSTDAAAQAPVLTVTVNGTSVSISWTGVPGALGYTIEAGTAPGLANIGTVNVPASITQGAVTAPPGLYFLRVRATAGTVVGPFSNEVPAAVGGASTPSGPCNAPPAGPEVTAAVNGGAVTLSWPPIPGAIGYQVQLSRFPGGTELAENTANVSYARYLGMPGAFYGRVGVLTACGTAISTEVSFAITSLAGSGPRAPDPPPGQMLPIPAYGLAVVNAVAAANPGDVAVGRPSECRGGNNRFLFKVLQALRQQDSRWGLNYKRGNFPTLSEDIITYNGTNRPDEGESHVYVIDIIGGNCFAGTPKFGDVSHETWSNRGQPYCGTEWCARWTLAPFLAAGFPPDQR